MSRDAHRPRSVARARSTLARHAATLPNPGPVAALTKMLGVTMAVVVVSGVSVATFAALERISSFTDQAVDIAGQDSVPPDIGAIEGGVNLLVTGTDECEPEYAHIFGDRCTGADAGSQLNDVNMLVHISDSPRRVTVVSFPRDLMIRIPSCPRPDGSESPGASNRPINEAWGAGGLNCVVRAVSDLSGLDIQFSAKVSFGNVINITDAIGGVDVCLASGIRDHNTGIDWPPGERTVAGVEALQFLRTRYGVGDGSDLGRISNQQQYLSRMARKLTSDEVLSDIPTLVNLATTAVDNITPSKSLTNPLTLVQIALAVKDVSSDEIVFVQYPTLPDPDDPNKRVPHVPSAQALWDALETNQPVQLTGDVGSHDGVVESPTPDNAPPATKTNSPPTPTEGSIALPSDITGSTAAQQTCSNGNVRQ